MVVTMVMMAARNHIVGEAIPSGCVSRSRQSYAARIASRSYLSITIRT
jgi:hypothetical protein